MIAGATRGSGGSALARHLLSRKGGQIVRTLDARHLAAPDLKSQIRELVSASRRGRTARPVHHIHIDPPPGGDARAVMNVFVRHYEKEFGLRDVPRCGVEHVKGGRSLYHLIYSLVRPDGRCASLSHEYARREKVSRIVEFECGLPLIRGKHNRAVAQALRADGRADVANAMQAAGLLDGRPAIAAQTPRERAQAERTDVPVADVRAAALAAWRASDDGPAFAAALAANGLRLAQGKRGAVIMDRAGAAHSAARILAAAARAGGEKIPAAAVKRRLDGLSLTPLEDVKNDRSRQSTESRARDIHGGAGGAPNQPATTATPVPVRRARGRTIAGRDQNPTRNDRSDTRPAQQEPGRNRHHPRSRFAASDRVAAKTLGTLDVSEFRAKANAIRYGPARRAVRDRVAAHALAGIDVAAAAAAAHRIAAAGNKWSDEMASDRHEIEQIFSGGKEMRGIRATQQGMKPKNQQDYKLSLLSGVVADSDLSPWKNDIYRVNRGKVGARVQMRDGGWLEIRPEIGTVRTWGRTGTADGLASAIAAEEGWGVERLRQSGDISATDNHPRKRQTPDQTEVWWREHGYDATASHDGVWVDAGATRLQDIGDKVRFHGELTNEGARAIALKAREIWGGYAELTGEWSQDDRDLIWLESRRSGVDIANCEPSDAARTAWETETATARQDTEKLLSAQSASQRARVFRDAAGGDMAALARLDPDVRAFVASYLDDDQRKAAAAADLADIVPEMKRFRALGAEERRRAQSDGRSDPAHIPGATSAPDAGRRPEGPA